MIWHGRDWKNEENLRCFKNNSSKILDFKLAIENFQDFNNVKIDKFKEIETMWKDVNDLSKTEKELIEISQNVIGRYLSLIDEIGKQHFIFYQDGTIEYRK